MTKPTFQVPLDLKDVATIMGMAINLCKNSEKHGDTTCPFCIPIAQALNQAIFRAAQAERERCCQIIFGQCGSDNAAQRTVDAIRKETP